MKDWAGFYAQIGSRIRQAREEKKITQDHLASIVSLSRTSITNIEKGRQKLLLHTFLEIATALQVRPENLLPEAGVQLEQKLEEYLKDRTPSEREFVRKTIASTRRR
jgi:transcriptional regulator with XRE-family HTH domain